MLTYFTVSYLLEVNGVFHKLAETGNTDIQKFS